jgi:hypothetical protein
LDGSQHPRVSEAATVAPGNGPGYLLHPFGAVTSGGIGTIEYGAPRFFRRSRR